MLVLAGRDEDVGRLDVTMHEAERVRRGEARGDLRHDAHGVRRRERPLGRDERPRSVPSTKRMARKSDPSTSPAS